jgi:endonuclease/exonuclease/phosphatase family metal-dependent hydrolase
MVTLLFWNINKKALTSLLRELVDAHAPDVIALAECTMALDTLLSAVNGNGLFTYRISPNAAKGPVSRLTVLTRLPRAAIRAFAGNEKCAIRHLNSPINSNDFLLIAMHLISKMEVSADEQAMLATRLRPLIAETEKKVGHKRSVVMGDLNMDPFESGVTNSEALHAVGDRKLAAKLSRTVQGQERFYFYNPLPRMLASDTSGPPGTYYRPSSSTEPTRWHIYDQVLIRPELLPNFNYHNLSVLISTGKTPLMKLGRPDRTVGSDHLPLLLKI